MLLFFRLLVEVGTVLLAFVELGTLWLGLVNPGNPADTCGQSFLSTLSFRTLLFALAPFLDSESLPYVISLAELFCGLDVFSVPVNSGTRVPELPGLLNCFR